MAKYQCMNPDCLTLFDRGYRGPNGETACSVECARIAAELSDRCGERGRDCGTPGHPCATHEPAREQGAL